MRGIKINKDTTKRFQILSFDGGGIKGLFSAAILSNIEKDLSVCVADYFDLIVGTSTGGIIALGLSIGMSPREIVEFYVEKGPSIFGRATPSKTCKMRRWIRHLIKNKFESSHLKEALIECFQDKKMSDCTKRLVIPSYNIDRDDIYLFKTPHHVRLRRDYKEPIWKVAMATCAAPTYFPSFRELDHIRLVDGGVWVNNPTMVGVVEAKSMLEIPLNAIKVLSLGTTNEIKGRSNKLNNGGLFQWMFDAIEVIMRGQSIGAYTQAKHLLGKDNIHRLDPIVPDGLFALDKLSVDELLSTAASESRHFAPVFEEKYMDHKAPEFIRFHS